MMTTRETNTTHDHSPDDPQTTFTSRIASVMRRGNGRTGVLTFLSNLVRTPGECTQVWDINNSQHSDTLMVNIAESNHNNDNLHNNAFLRALMHNTTVRVIVFLMKWALVLTSTTWNYVT